MNSGTKIRTALVIAVSIHTALLATDVTGFANPVADYWYKVLSIVVNFVVVALTTYYNQDFTYEGSVGTFITRQMKAEQAEGYEGERLFTEEEENWTELSVEESELNPLEEVPFEELENNKGSDE